MDLGLALTTATVLWTSSTDLLVSVCEQEQQGLVGDMPASHLALALTVQAVDKGSTSLQPEQATR